jgi:hypothetical protein
MPLSTEPWLCEPHLNPDESNPLYCAMFIYNQLQITPSFLKWCFLLRFVVSAIRFTCPAYPILLIDITIVTFIEEYKLWISRLSIFLHVPASVTRKANAFSSLCNCLVCDSFQMLITGGGGAWSRYPLSSSLSLEL